jgi:hypothetical protein
LALVASPHHVRPLANRARKTESCSSPAFNALLQHYLPTAAVSNRSKATP